MAASGYPIWVDMLFFKSSRDDKKILWQSVFPKQKERACTHDPFLLREWGEHNSLTNQSSIRIASSSLTPTKVVQKLGVCWPAILLWPRCICLLVMLPCSIQHRTNQVLPDVVQALCMQSKRGHVMYTTSKIPFKSLMFPLGPPRVLRTDSATWSKNIHRAHSSTTLALQRGIVWKALKAEAACSLEMIELSEDDRLKCALREGTTELWKIVPHTPRSQF